MKKIVASALFAASFAVAFPAFASGSNDSDATPPTKDEVIQAMNDYASDDIRLLKIWNRPEAQIRCAEQLDMSMERTKVHERMGDYRSAYAQAHVEARDRSFCAVLQEEGLFLTARGRTPPLRVPLEISAAYAGAHLSRSVINVNKSGGTIIDRMRTDIAIARLFLEYAVSFGVPGAQQNLDRLMAEFFDEPVTQSVTASQAPLVDAVSINGEFLSNKFAFNQKYDGKPMRIRGVVNRISSDGSSVMLVGTSSVPKDMRGFQHFVYCELNPDVRSTVASLSVDSEATIAGRYDASFKQLGMWSYLTLVDCQIVP